MAKIIMNDAEPFAINSARYILNFLFSGLLIGLLYLLIKYILDKIISTPSVSGDISIILASTIGAVTMLRLRLAQPIIVSISSAISLFGLAYLTSVFGWQETFLWSILLFVLSYLAFSWLMKLEKASMVIALTIITVVLTRIAFAL